MKKLTALLLVMLLLLTGCQGKTVMKGNGFKLSNTEFAYYYWSEFFYAREATGAYMDLDFEKPLDEQMYSETQTWQDYMIDRTVTMVEETMSLALAAEAAGHKMSQDYEDALDDVIVNFADAAMGQGYKNTSAYLKDSYGRGAEEETFREYLRYTHLASSYADALYAESVPSEDEALAYMSANPAAYEEGGLEQAMEDLHSENYNNAILEAINAYTFTVSRDNIRITAPKGLYE